MGRLSHRCMCGLYTSVGIKLLFDVCSIRRQVQIAASVAACARSPMKWCTLSNCPRCSQFVRVQYAFANPQSPPMVMFALYQLCPGLAPFVASVRARTQWRGYIVFCIESGLHPSPQLRGSYKRSVFHSGTEEILRHQDYVRSGLPNCTLRCLYQTCCLRYISFTGYEMVVSKLRISFSYGTRATNYTLANLSSK